MNTQKCKSIEPRVQNISSFKPNDSSDDTSRKSRQKSTFSKQFNKRSVIENKPRLLTPNVQLSFNKEMVYKQRISSLEKEIYQLKSLSKQVMDKNTTLEEQLEVELKCKSLYLSIINNRPSSEISSNQLDYDRNRISFEVETKFKARLQNKTKLIVSMA